MHLTNYAINKFSTNYVFNQSEINDNIGHKRSYTAIFQVIVLKHVDFRENGVRYSKAAIRNRSNNRKNNFSELLKNG